MQHGLNLAASVEPKKLPQDLEVAASVSAAVGKHDAILQPKFDGWRVLYVIGSDGVARGYTRTGNSVTGKLPAIETQLSAAFPPGTVLDGEVVAFEQHGEKVFPKWGVVQSVLGSGTAKAALCSAKLTYVVFDLLAHGEVDARAASYTVRRAALQQAFAGSLFDSRVILCPELPATDESHAVLVEQGYEGSVVKWTDSPYSSGKRGKGQFKIKPQATVDAVVVGFKPGTEGSSFSGMVGAVEFGQWDGEHLAPRGRCSGMDWNTRVDMTQNPDAWLGKVIEVAHMGVMDPTPETPHGAFRHPQFKRLRLDKDPMEVTIHDA